MKSTIEPFNPADQKFLTAREAASRYGMSVSWYYEEVAAGRIPKPIKLGKSARWPLSVILEDIETRTVEAGTAKQTAAA